MDSLSEPVEESSTNNFVNSNIARELLKRDLRLARKWRYPVCFFFYFIYCMVMASTRKNNQKQNKDHGNKDLFFSHDHGLN